MVLAKWCLLCHWANRIGSRNVTGISAISSNIGSHVTEISADTGSHITGSIANTSDIRSHLLLLQS
jgi:hypothetical protein